MQRLRPEMSAATSTAEIRAKQDECWTETSKGRSRDESRSRIRLRSGAETRAEAEACQTRCETRERTTSNDRLKLELVRRSLLYSESETAAVVLHMENDLHVHANGCCKRRTSCVSKRDHDKKIVTKNCSN